MPALTDSLVARYQFPVWLEHRSVGIQLLYLLLLPLFLAVYVISVGNTTLMILNTLSSVSLVAVFITGGRMSSAAYALLTESLQLFMLNSMRGGVILHASDQVSTLNDI
jgi:hypothetical protein